MKMPSFKFILFKIKDVIDKLKLKRDMKKMRHYTVKVK